MYSNNRSYVVYTYRPVSHKYNVMHNELKQ